MILYLTKQTIERFGVKMPEELDDELQREVGKALMQSEQNDNLMKWGGKIFYFDRRKCIQFANFASKFTLFLVDIKKDMIPEIPNYIANYLFKLYADDKEMVMALKKMLQESSLSCYGKLTDRSTISTLNATQSSFLDDGYYLYNFINDGILDIGKVNYNVNFIYPITVNVNGKKGYHYTGELFREMVLVRYGSLSSKL